MNAEYERERKNFDAAFMRWLLVPDGTCWGRDVLRNCKPFLWKEWQRKAGMLAPAESVEEEND